MDETKSTIYGDFLFPNTSRFEIEKKVMGIDENCNENLNDKNTVFLHEMTLLLKCLICKKNVLSEEEEVVVFIPKCRHSYHMKCVLIDIIDDNFVNNYGTIKKNCEICGGGDDENLKKNQQQINQESPSILDMNGNTSDENNSFKKRSEKEMYENRFKKIERKKDSLLSVKKANGISSLLRDPEIKKRRRVKYSALLKNKIDITLLGEYNLNIEDYYHVIGVCDWDSLLGLGFKREHIDNKNFEVSDLVHFYKVDYFILRDSIGLDIQFLSHNRFTSKELNLLGIDMNLLIREGLTQNQFIKFEIPFQEWKNVIDAKKEDILDTLKITSKNMIALKWDIQNFVKYFNLTDEELLKFIV